MAVHLGLSRPTSAVGADAESFEEAEFARDEAGHPEASRNEFPADVVDPAQTLAGLADHLAVQEFRQSHQDPGSFPTMDAQCSSPRFRRNSAAGCFRVTTDVTEWTSGQGTWTAFPER